MRQAAELEEDSPVQSGLTPAAPPESHFELVIRVRHDEMAQWPPEKLTAFFDAVGVVMAAKTHPAAPPRRPIAAAAEAPADVEERFKRIEQTVDTVRRHVATLHESMAEDLKDFEAALASQNHVIQSTRTAMSQTDDLVERVVEALENLQTSTLDRPQEFAAIN